MWRVKEERRGNETRVEKCSGCGKTRRGIRRIVVVGRAEGKEGRGNRGTSRYTDPP